MKFFENKKKDKVWRYQAYSENSAISLVNVIIKKFNCKILSNPKQNKDGMWEFSFTNPLRETKHG